MTDEMTPLPKEFSDAIFDDLEGLYETDAKATFTYTAADLEAVAQAALGAAEEAVRLWGDHRVIRAISAADIVDDYTRGKNDD